MRTPPEAITLMTCGPGIDLFAHDFADLFDAFHFLADKPCMASDHADREPGADDAGPGVKPLSIARLSAKIEWSREPTSRTVVTPASSVCLAD